MNFKIFWERLCHDRRQLLVSVYSKFVYTPILRNLGDRTYLRLTYWVFIGKKLHLNNPKGFNEKLQWLKLYDRNPNYHVMVDKCLVREYIKNVIGEEYLVPIVGVWDRFEDIDFNSLPDKFVIKCTHDSGSAIVCNDKSSFDWEAAHKKIARCLNRDLFYWGREWPYQGLTPRIICEHFLDNGTDDLEDYKFMCFNGEPKMVFTCTERRSEEGLKVTFFDMDWNKLPFYRHYPASSKQIEKPSQYDKMVQLAKVLSKNIPFVRIDFYEVKGKVYFGEITFYPGCGFEEFHPDEWDNKLGEMIKID